jgi:FkbM family methyltransferase
LLEVAAPVWAMQHIQRNHLGDNKMEFSSPTALAVRRFGQRLGILRPMVRFWRRCSGYQYEDAFDKAIFANLQENDVIWDVGANVGLYTRKFSDAVGPYGHVIAFEPSPRTAATLMAAVKDLRNVSVEVVALSDNFGEATFFVGPDENNFVDGLSRSRSDEIEAKVAVRRGDDYFEKFPPTKIKIDIEGFEEEALMGMPLTLRSANLKAVFVEVHFQTLAKRGKPNAPAEIVKMLREARFNVTWTDSSHICAIKNE